MPVGQSKRGGDGDSRPVGLAALAVVIGHPLRLRIMRAMTSPERVRSPVQLSRSLRVPVETLAYHVRLLADLGFITQVDRRAVRGSVENFYAPTERLDEVWKAEWDSLPATLRQILLASTLAAAVGSIGAAIDDGTFAARADSPLGQGTFWTDERGAEEAFRIIREALSDLSTAAAAAKDRLKAKGETGFLVAFLLSGFEGSIRPTEPSSHERGSAGRGSWW